MVSIIEYIQCIFPVILSRKRYSIFFTVIFSFYIMEKIQCIFTVTISFYVTEKIQCIFTMIISFYIMEKIQCIFTVIFSFFVTEKIQYIFTVTFSFFVMEKIHYLFTVLSSNKEQVSSYILVNLFGRPSTLDLKSVTAIVQSNSAQIPDCEGDDRLQMASKQGTSEAGSEWVG